MLIPFHAAQAEAARLAAIAAAEAAAAAERAYQADLAATRASVAQYNSYSNNYAWGNCTYWVASHIQVPDSMGNATNWSSGLLSIGWRQGPARVGAVGVSHNGYMGHVVYVVAVDGNGVLISEMNYQGLNVVDQRYASPGEFDYFYR